MKQLAPDDLVQPGSGGGGGPRVLNLSMRIVGLDITRKTLVVWDGHRAEVYEIGPTHLQQATTFETEATCLAVFGEYVYRCGAVGWQKRTRFVCRSRQIKGSRWSVQVHR